MIDQFFVQLYELTNDGQIETTGIHFESADVGREVPRVGDTIVTPLSKSDFEPRNPKTHVAFEVVRRYFLPDITNEQANIVKLLVRRRTLADGELALFDVRGGT